jgi:hypothetical protein
VHNNRTSVKAEHFSSGFCRITTEETNPNSTGQDGRTTGLCTIEERNCENPLLLRHTVEGFFKLRLLNSYILLEKLHDVQAAGHTDPAEEKNVCETSIKILFCAADDFKIYSFSGKKGKVFPLQTWTGPCGSRRLRLQNF